MLSRLLRIADKCIDVVIWLHDNVMLYIAVVWLMPLFAVIMIHVLGLDLRPVLRDRLDDLFVYALVGCPFWLGFSLFAEFSGSAWAARLKYWQAKAPAYVGYVVLGLGGLFWMFGVI